MKAALKFLGCEDAESFTKEIEESFNEVLNRNFISDTANGPIGFVTASIDGRYWADTMWSRDQGTFFRELVHYGEFEKAKQLFTASLEHVALNEAGYYSFPMYVYMNEPMSGGEMDGTALVVISSILLWERLPMNDPFRDKIEQFITADTSPVRYILMLLANQPFVEGCGEFGGGLTVPTTPYYNVVQNSLVAFMLDMAGERFGINHHDDRVVELKTQCREAALELKRQITERMIFENGTWIWCVDPKTGKQAEDEVLYGEGNKGFAGINGVLSHSADVLGNLPILRNEWFLGPSIQTFWKLLSTPKRMEQFVHYGMYSQFELEFDGTLTSPSYGQGYAIQCMLLMDQPELYTKAIQFLIRATMEPTYPITRNSKYWFYERYLSLESGHLATMDEGCGALNLVNVSEPLKVARLMVGIDDSTVNDIRIVPRLPLGWTGFDVERVPVRTVGGHTLINIHAVSNGNGSILHVYGEANEQMAGLSIRLGTAEKPEWKVIEPGQQRFDVKLSV